MVSVNEIFEKYVLVPGHVLGALWTSLNVDLVGNINLNRDLMDKVQYVLDKQTTNTL